MEREGEEDQDKDGWIQTGVRIRAEPTSAT